jgi:hypothetical protein
MISGERRTNRWLQGDAAAVALLVFVFVASNWELLAGKVTEHWDGSDFFEPMYSLLARMTRSGHFLLWNPFSNGGSPDFAEPDIGAFSPITLLFGLIAGPGPVAFRLYWLSIWLFGGLGMYVLSRAMKAPPWAALIPSLGFVFSGFYLGHAEGTSCVYSYSFLPWIVWRMRAALLTGNRAPACEAGALWGLSALAGTPAITIPTAMFLAMAAPAWLSSRPEVSRDKRVRDMAITLALVAIVGIAVLAPAYLSFRHEVAGYSGRSQPLPRDIALPSQSLGFNWLTAFLSPVIVIATFGMPDWPQMDVAYMPVYAGSALLVFAGFALWQSRSRWWTGVLFVTGLLFLGFALGGTLPLRGWLYDFVPPTRYFRHAPVFRGFALMALALLAAQGGALIAERLRRAEGPGFRLKPLAIAAGALAAVSLCAVAWVFGTLTDTRWQWFAPFTSFHLFASWVCLAAACAAAVRWRLARQCLPGVLVALTVIDLTGAFYVTMPVPFNLKPKATALPAQPSLPLLDLGLRGFSRDGSARANDNLAALQPVFFSYTALLNPTGTIWAHDPLLLSKVTGPRRVWFADRVPTVPATPEAFAVFQKRVRDLNGLVIVRQERSSLLQTESAPLPASDFEAIANAPLAEPIGGHVRSYRANDLVLDVNCPRAGFLLLTDRWSRSWTAAVNGKPVSIEGGDFLFRLIPVSAGVNHVEMHYDVAWVYPLIALSWATLAAVALGSIWRLRSPRRSLAPVAKRSLPAPAELALR